MKIIKVNDRKTRRRFLDVAKVIYQSDNIWVCPFDNEIEAIFDPGKNPYFKHGEAERWILEDDNKNLTGRIAAFIDRNLAFSYEQPTGGVGFFECTNDRNSAFLLFDTAVEWLKTKGMQATDGPINFGETDKYWGLLVGGFTHPSFEVPYNHPYYQELFEAYGFKTYYKMEGFHFDLSKPLPERFIKIAERIAMRPGYDFLHFSWKNEKKFARDFASVFNEAWPTFKVNFEPVEASYINEVLKKARAIIDEEFIWFAYFEGKPIAIYVMFPDLNQILRHLNGKQNLFNIIRFIYLKKTNTMTRAKGLLMGVIPKFRHIGIESAIILNLRKTMDKKPHYREVEFSWVADFNPGMKKILMSVGCVPVKTYITYRYLFDHTKEFRRYPIPEFK